MGSPTPATPSVPIDPAQEAANLAELFFDLSEAVEQYRIDNRADLTPQDKIRLDNESRALSDRGNSFNAESIGDTLQLLKSILENLKQVTADAQSATAKLKKVGNIIAIATGGVALGAAIATGDLASIKAAVAALAKTVLNANQDEAS